MKDKIIKILQYGNVMGKSYEDIAQEIEDAIDETQIAKQKIKEWLVERYGRDNYRAYISLKELLDWLDRRE